VLNNCKIAVVLPAYNAEKTLGPTFHDIPKEIIDIILLVDDHSRDETVLVAERLKIETIVHPQNLGYGGNQKTCYREALRRGADIVIMLHPDYQYSPRLLVAMAAMIAYGEYDVVLGSRILAQSSIRGGMPRYKYISNRILTLVQNILMQQKLSEYHTGFRAFRKNVLQELPLAENSNDFIFDNQMLAQVIWKGFRIGELSCPTRYAAESSSISFGRSVSYGLGVLAVCFQYLIQKHSSATFRVFSTNGRKLDV
jgi:glycosyltransferase involved in cell wall biosynthesis